MFSFLIAVCKSCLVKHLEENNTCPTCNIMIHQSHPLQYISFDRTMQDIVYKLVPDLQERECFSVFYFQLRCVGENRNQTDNQQVTQSDCL